MEGPHLADGVLPAVAAQGGAGQEGGQKGLAPHRAAARAAAAVGGGEGLVEVEVAHVEAHVARPGHPHDGIEVGPVVVDEAPGGVDEGGER